MADKSRRVFHDGAIRTAVPLDKKQQKPVKELQFSQLARGRQPAMRMEPQSSRSLSGKGSSSMSSKTTTNYSTSNCGKEKSFESSLPHSQLQVGGILGCHWHPWSSNGEADCTAVEVLHFEISCPLPPPPTCVTEPLKFPSYTSGSAKAYTLQGQMDKMLERGGLELVDHSGPGYYGWLFLVNRGGGGGGWHPVNDMFGLNGYVTLAKFKLKTVSLMLGSIKKRDFIFLIDLKDTYFQTPIHPNSWPHLWITLGGKVYQLRAVFRPFYSSQIFTNVFALVSEGDHKRGIWRLVGDHKVGSSIASTLKASSSLLQGPGYCHQHEEIKSWVFQHTSVSRDADRHHLRGFPDGFPDCQISGLGGHISSSPSSSCKGGQ